MKTITVGRSFFLIGLCLTLLGLTGTSIAQTESTKTHSGVIRSINLKLRTMVVESPVAKLLFIVPTDAEIVVKDKTQKADLDKLMVGDNVEVKYTTDDTGDVARRVTVIGAAPPLSLVVALLPTSQSSVWISWYRPSMLAC